MPCPFYSKAENECALLPIAPTADDDRPEQQDEPEVIDRAVCLDTREAFRSCSIFKRQAIEETRAY
jgi:hypothetical protein